MRALALFAVVAFAFVGPSAESNQPSSNRPPAADKAFADFWKADNPRDAERAAERIVRTGVDLTKRSRG